MIDLVAIRAFLAVAEERSFVGAARALSVTPASVTRSVAGLEKALGVQLLLRTTRKVSLTSAGAVYAANVGPLVKKFDEAAEALREQHGLVSGLIRISGPMSMGVRLLPDVVTQFRTLHPETRVEMHLSDRFVDILAENYDLAIRISTAPTDKSTIWRKLCVVPRYLVASPAYVTAFGMPETPDDLRSAACLAYAEQGMTETWELTKGGQTRTLTAGSTFSSNSGDLLRGLALNSEGIALLPFFLVEDNLADGSLVRVLPEWTPSELWLTLYYPPYDKLPIRVATFSDFFETYITEALP